MKTQRIFNALFLTIALLLSNVGVALAFPPTPFSVNGTVKLDGANVALGTIISARINGVEYASGAAEMWEGNTVYYFDVPGDDTSTAGIIEGGVLGDTVVFYVGSYIADQTASWQNNDPIEINLTAATNHAPVANAQSATTNEDTAKAITLTGTDSDGDLLDYSVVDAPSHGTLTGTAPALTYTPDANYNGPDSFTFKVNDGTVDSAPATVSITVTAVNDLPVANAQSVSTNEDTAKAITLTGSDTEGSTLTYSVVGAPSHGALSGTAPALTYTPAANYNGPDSFTFKVNDGTVDSAPATVSITVTAVNDLPVANAQSATTNEDTAKAITLTGSDTEGSTLTYSIVTAPLHGALSGTAPAVTYTPAANYNGPDSFTFKVNDGTVDGAPATVSITVTAVNDLPVANAQSATTNEDTAKAITLTGSDTEGSTLTYAIVTAPAHGTLSGTAPSVTYTPAANYNGPDSFTFKVNDGTVDSAPATVSITVTAINDLPVANAQSVSTTRNTAKAITLTGSDIDGNPLTYIVVANPTHGILSGTGVNRTYTPDTNYTGPDSFTFKVNDGTIDSIVATVDITVTFTNVAPVANAQSVSTNEDTAKAITLTGTDADGDPMTYAIVTAPLHGALSGTAPALTYTPAANYNGPDSFTFKVNDGTVDSAPATVSITVTAVNDLPVANAQSATTNEDIAKAITLTGSDIDGDLLSFVIVTSPSQGVLSGTGANRTYTPALNYNGPDSFTFKVNDGTVDSAPATVSITVTVVNDLPVADAQSATTNEDTAKAITLTGSDTEGSTLTYAIVTAPLHGSLSGTAPSVTYTPAANYNGPDSFTFKVNDGTVDSAPATVSITVTAVNDLPVANAQSVSTTRNTAKAITLTGSDIDGNPLTYIVVANPTHGSLSGTAPALTYTPAANYTGPDSFTFKVNDGTIDSIVATVDITVAFANVAPIANAQSVSTNEDTAKAITLIGTDADGDPLTYVVVANPTHGTLSGTAPALTYTPAANYNGPDSFTFKVNDGTVDSAPATVSITVTAVNDLPVANAQSATTNEDTAKAITLTGTDADGDPMTYAIITAPSHGALSGTAPALTYTPAANYNGPDSFTFKVNDGTVDSAPATVSITVTAVNDLPVANAQSATTNEDTAKAITLTGSDTEGSTLTYAIVTAPAHGTLSGTAPALTYTPAANYNGPDSFTFKVNDGTVDSAPATVSITVTAINDLPVANAQSVSTTRNTAKAITLTGSDIDGNPLTYIVVANPTHGILSGTGVNRTYTPDTNYTGPDSFTFKVNDGTIDSIVATVDITVTFTNVAPVANAQSVSTNEDTAKAITLTGTDADGDPMTYAIVTAPLHGALSGTAPALTYTPAANYNGPDSFTFKVNDGTVDSAPATVSITVTAVNDLPVANAQSATTNEDTAKAITLAGSDTEGSTLTYAIVTAPAHGTLSGTAPALTYTPVANYNGPDSFTFKVNDGTADSAPATVSITVTAVNDLPVANAQSVSTTRNTAKAITLTGSDIDGNPLTYIVVANPTHGILSGTGANRTYTPDTNYTGPDSFTFKVNDGTIDSIVATVDITVTFTNVAPIANAQSVSTNEDTAKAITLTGTDADGDPMTYAIITAPSHGTLSGTAPALTYTPALNYNGPDSFTFKVNDGTVDSAPATVSITVTAVNDLPVANAQSATTNEDTAKAITLTGSDTEGSTLTYAIVTAPLHGTLSGTAPAVTYTPAANYNGPDSFTFKVNDGTADSAPATVSITVTAVNDLPVANAQSVSTTRNTAKAITLTGSDIDGNPLTYIVVANPTHGTLSGTGANRTYTPAANYTGPDSFTFKVNDGTIDSIVATVDITVTFTNVAPIANAQSVSTNEDTAKAITLTGTDADGDPMTYAIITAPSHGTLTGTAPALTYTPAANYNGPDSFTFKVNDGTVDSAPATVSITVTAVNDLPVANAQSATTNEDTAKAITLTGSDTEGSTLTYSIVTAPLHGTLSGTAPAVTYTPAANYNGPDSFTFKVNDGTADSAPATVSITVTAINDLPVANAQSVSTIRNTAKAITLTGSDIDGNPLTYIVVANPTHGTLSGTGANRTYTPAANYTGPDSFTFKVNDGTIDSIVATVDITVTFTNVAPIANAQSVSTNEDTAKAITLTGTDADGDPLTYVVVANPTHGALSGTAPALTYTPAANYNGPDSFTFKVNDGTVDSAPATVSITVTAVNDLPVANAQSATTNEDTAKAITLTGSDTEGSTLTYSIVTAPLHGTLSGTAPAVTYTPAANYNGPDSFTFKVNDGTVDSVPAPVSITVTAVNDAPTDISISNSNIDENQALDTLVGTLSTTDLDLGDLFAYSFCGGTDDASFAISGDSLKSAVIFDYETKNSYSVCIRSTDSGALSVTKTVTITVNNLIDTQTFTDVPTTFWAWGPIESIYAAGITSGCTTSPLAYCPATPVTRAQMAIFLLRGMHGASFTPPAATGTRFTDVPLGTFGAAWIEQLAAEGITSGCGGGNYCPTTPVSRAQMAIFLVRAKYGTAFTPPTATGIFPDVVVGSFGADYIEQLSADGITSGCGGGYYCPSATVSRAQMAVFLQKTFNLPLP